MSQPQSFTITVLGSANFGWTVNDIFGGILAVGSATSVGAAAGNAVAAVGTQLNAASANLATLATNWQS